MASSSNPGTLQHFTLFALLPPELRLNIWRDYVDEKYIKALLALRTVKGHSGKEQSPCFKIIALYGSLARLDGRKIPLVIQGMIALYVRIEGKNVRRRIIWSNGVV